MQEDTLSLEEIIGRTALIAQRGANLPYMQADTLFEMGKVLANTSDKSFISEMAEGLGLKKTTLQNARTIALRYKGDKEKFLKEFKESGANTFGTFIQTKLAPGTRPKPSFRDATARNPQLFAAVIKEVKHYRHHNNPESLILLSSIQKYIAKNIPPDAMIMDRNYVKYNNCVCCGEMAGEDGNKLITMPDLKGVKIPVCESCLEERRQPDLKQAVVMYAKYALDIERAYNRIPDEED